LQLAWAAYAEREIRQQRRSIAQASARTLTEPARMECDESARQRPVRINLRVPADAKIWFDGSQTNQTGTMQSFESPPLAVGPQYAYQVRIQWKQNGKDVTQTRQIKVHAGDVISLTLGPPQMALAPVRFGTGKDLPGAGHGSEGTTVADRRHKLPAPAESFPGTRLA
jgi:uncharacterized protein (TIGR03000 family)